MNRISNPNRVLTPLGIGRITSYNVCYTKLLRLKVIQETQSGKGLAVRNGMLEATGQYRIFCDADFSMPVSEIRKFVPAEGQSYDRNNFV